MTDPHQAPPRQDDDDTEMNDRPASFPAGLVQQIRETQRHMVTISGALMRLRGGAARREAMAADVANTIARLHALRAHTPPVRATEAPPSAKIISLTAELIARRRTRGSG